ncbi:hypothetical protein NMY22_g12316 [Coprinellus aureogranulatus]|nr:hypothetical protein NMY22_g12316 [Coprinellus aureogranulatus]
MLLQAKFKVRIGTWVKFHQYLALLYSNSVAFQPPWCWAAGANLFDTLTIPIISLLQLADTSLIGPHTLRDMSRTMRRIRYGRFSKAWIASRDQGATIPSTINYERLGAPKQSTTRRNYVHGAGDKEGYHLLSEEEPSIGMPSSTNGLASSSSMEEIYGGPISHLSHPTSKPTSPYLDPFSQSEVKASVGECRPVPLPVHLREALKLRHDKRAALPSPARVVPKPSLLSPAVSSPRLNQSGPRRTPLPAPGVTSSLRRISASPWPQVG